MITYDELGRVVQRAQGIGSAPANFVAHATVQQYYDVNGQVVYSTDADGYSTCTLYDEEGRVAEVKRQGQKSTTYTYTRNPEHPRIPGTPTYSMQTTITGPGGEQAFSLRRAGRTWFRQSASKVSTEKVYEAGRLRRAVTFGEDMTPLLVHTASYVPNSQRAHIQWEADVPSSRDAGQVVPPSAANIPNCDMSEDPYPGCTDQTDVGFVVRYHDAAGRVIGHRDAAGVQSQTTYATDGTGVVVSGNTAGETTKHFYYDDALRVARKEWGPVQTPMMETYQRGQDGRLTEVLRTHLATQRQEQKVWSFDNHGRLHSAQTFAGHIGDEMQEQSATVFDYDVLGRLKSKALRVQGTPWLRSGKAYTFAFERSAAGRLTKVKYPSGRDVGYQYDESNGLLEAVVLKRKAGSTQGPRVQTVYQVVSRDDAGRITAEMMADARITHEYDADHGGREVGRTVWGSLGKVSQSEMVHDALGRLAHVTRTQSSDGPRMVDYHYTTAGLLAGEQHGSTVRQSRSLVYEYDQAGRRTNVTRYQGRSEQGKQRQRYVPGTHRLSQVEGQAISFDEWGQQTNDHRGQEFTWSLFGEMKSLQAADGLHEDFAYDAFGQRVARTVGTHTEYFATGAAGISDSGAVLSMKKADGSHIDVVAHAWWANGIWRCFGLCQRRWQFCAIDRRNCGQCATHW